MGMVAAVLATAVAAQGDRTPKRAPLRELQAQMEELARGFHGVLGYSFHLRGKSDERLSFRGDERFPTASTIKTAIMAECLHQIEQGKLKIGDELPVQPSTASREEGGPGFFLKDEAKLPLGEWLHLMITLSDNTATINLRDRLGQRNVNDWLDAHGFKDTRLLNGRETDSLGLRPLQRQYGLGMTTPNDMVRLFEMIRDNQAGSPASCDRMQRLLSHQYWDNCILSQVPPDAAAMAKSGALDECRSDVAIFRTPAGEVVLAVYTRDQKDQRWVQDNEGVAAIRKLAALVWHHYDPGHTWSPPAGAEKLLPDS
jgi:beta-lactamase class A